MNKQKRVIIIAGPTGSGKTDLSLQLAVHFNTAIISADSRQCYRELNIGVAKPPEESLQSVKHYFINSHSIHENVNAEIFEKYALNAAEEIFEQNDTAIMVGGTGMYIKAFCEGLDEIPSIDLALRNNIITNYNDKGLFWLQQQVRRKDPDFWKEAEQQNPQRLMRALEVITATGISITQFRKNKKKERPFGIIKVGIELPKQQLYEQINNRVDVMIKNGLVEEVSSLLPYKELNALQTVGYKEIFDYLEGYMALSESIQKIKSNTRQYAKRQLTWFKRDKNLKWFVPGHLLESFLAE